jgi:DNA-binding winged helix-turn-helix (wHTH) protein
MSEDPHKVYQFGEFQLDLRRGCLWRGSEEISLRPKSFHVLTVLVEAEGALISRKDLIDAVWPDTGDNVGSDDLLEQCLKDIWKKLEDDRHQVVKTIPRRGCRLDLEVTECAARPSAVHPTVEDVLTDSQEEPTVPRLTNAFADRSEDIVNRGKDETETFEVWLGGRGSGLTFSVATCVMTTAIISIFASTYFNNNVAFRAAGGFQCVVILIGLLYARFWNKSKGFGPEDSYTSEQMLRAGFESSNFYRDVTVLNDELKRYTRYWQWLLFWWIPLYIVFTVGSESATAKIFQIVFNILNTAMILLCFNILNKDPNDEDSHHITASVLNTLLFMVWVGVLAVLIVIRNFTGATLLTGITAGITMALFVGRLQSKFLGPRFWILYCSIPTPPFNRWFYISRVITVGA